MATEQDIAAFIQRVEARLASLENQQFTETQLKFFNSLDERLSGLEAHCLNAGQLEFINGLPARLGAITVDCEQLISRAQTLDSTLRDLIPAYAQINTAQAKKEVINETYDKLSLLMLDDIRKIEKTMDEFRRSATALYATKHELALVEHKQAPSGASPGRPRIKVQEPPRFQGKREDCNSFLSQLALYFHRLKDEFATDDTKISTAISLLDGPPLKYMEPYIPELLSMTSTADRSLPMQSYEQFTEVLTNNFGLVNANVTNEGSLRNLQQTGSAITYTAEFRRLSVNLGFNDAALCAYYRHGLKDAIKDVLVHESAYTTFQTLSQRAIAIDNEIFARAIEKKNTTRSPRPTGSHPPPNTVSRTHSVPAGPTSSGPSPMDLGATRRITADERLDRMNKGLCLTCAQTGHFAKDCPNKNRHQAKLANVEDTDEIVFELGKDNAQ